jgi:hypothetical protein
MPTATQKSRKNVAGQSAPATTRPAVAQIFGEVIPDGELGSVTGRGRTAEPLPAALTEQLAGFLAHGGAARASGTAAEVAKLMRQVTRYAKEQTDAGHPAKQSFRVEAKDSKNRPTRIRYSVHNVEVTDAVK